MSIYKKPGKPLTEPTRQDLIFEIQTLVFILLMVSCAGAFVWALIEFLQGFFKTVQINMVT